MMHNDERHLAELSVFVHGVLAGLHVLGILYNARRRNWLDASIHVAAAGYDVWALSRHVYDVKELRGVRT